MIKTVFLIPKRDNAGRPFPGTYRRELEERLMQFGGFSMRDNVVGAWPSGGRVFRDVSREYTVSLGSWRQLAGWLAVVDWAREQFQQAALYIEVAGIAEVLE